MKTVFLILFSIISLPFISFSQQIDEQKIQVLLDEYLIENDPGLSISVVQNQKQIFSHYGGFANLEHMIPITDSTKFVVGSISKQFTAFSILLLENQGKLSIDDDVTKYLPELTGLDHAITVKHFMNHTSGFRGNYDLIRLKGMTDEDVMSQEEMVDLLLRQKGLNFKPGTRFQYCNAGYVLLAEIVERVSEMSFTAFTEKFIFDPLEMKNSQFLDYTDEVVINKANSYEKMGSGYRNIPYNRSVKGSTGLHSTVTDLGLWVNNFNSMKVGNKAVFKKMRTKSTLNNGDTIPYALGQELKSYKGLDVVFHGGGDAGFRSYLLRVPQHDFSIAISGNFEAFNPLNLVYGLLDICLVKEIQQPTILDLPVYTNKDLARFEGNYQIFPGLYITIMAEKEQLYFKSFGSDDKLALPLLAENEFAFPARSHSKFKFYGDSLTWHFSDFYYPGKKVKLHAYENSEPEEFVGMYYSHELETAYQFSLKEDELIATHGLNEDIALIAIAEDTFITDSGYFGRITFTRNSKGELIGCNVSAQSSYDIHFQKLD
jgi:CubicO group peptidase (beta-lactamase class C family)